MRVLSQASTATGVLVHGVQARRLMSSDGTGNATAALFAVGVSGGFQVAGVGSGGDGSAVHGSVRALQTHGTG